MHRGLPCSKRKVRVCEALRGCLPSSLHQPSPRQKTSTTRVPTCDDNLINKFKQDFNLHRLIQVILLSFIFFLDRT
jgi:hypothetical protein